MEVPMVGTEVVVVAGSSPGVPGAFSFWISMSANIAKSETVIRIIRLEETGDRRPEPCNRARTCCRHGAPEERALEPQLLLMNVDNLPRQGIAKRVDQWFSDIRKENMQSFDDWLAVVATPAPSAAPGIRLSQGNVEFELRHGQRYSIEDTVRGVRQFRCIIDGRVPLIAFIDERGYRGAWITVINLFTIEEMVSMRELPDQP